MPGKTKLFWNRTQLLTYDHHNSCRQLCIKFIPILSLSRSYGREHVIFRGTWNRGIRSSVWNVAEFKKSCVNLCKRWSWPSSLQNFDEKQVTGSQVGRISSSMPSTSTVPSICKGTKHFKRFVSLLQTFLLYKKNVQESSHCVCHLHLQLFHPISVLKNHLKGNSLW